jgi:hypothetical protein
MSYADNRPGISRADDGKRWEAFVADKGRIIVLGVYPTIRQAVAARKAYWASTPAVRKGLPAQRRAATKRTRR